ncbi:TPA: MFS transporter [Serratia marcescens]
MSKVRRISLVIAICLGTFITLLDISIVNVTLPAMLESLQTNMSGLQWVVDAYALCLSALILSSGPMGDRFGRKRVWIYGVTLFTIGSLVCALAPSLNALLLGRVIQGVAGAAIIPAALSLLTHAFPKDKQRMRAIGIWSSVSSLALVVGPILGGILVHTCGWPSIFWINVPIGIIALILGGWSIRESAHPEHAALDPVGQVLSILWLGALTYGLIVAGEFGWHSTQSRFALYTALALFVFFIGVELRVKRPLLPVSLFRKADFAAYNIASFVLGFSCYSSVFFISLFLQQVQGWGPAAAGLRMAPEFLAMALAASCFAKFSARFTLSTLIIVGYGVIGSSLLLFTHLGTDSSYVIVAMCLFLLGLGMGLAMPATSALVMRSVDPQRSGMASATMNAFRQTGMTIGIALLGTLMSMKAVDSLTASLQANGTVNASIIAQTAIIKQQHSNSLLSTDLMQYLMHNAYARGFAVAMFWAGLLSLAMTVCLVVMSQTRFRMQARSLVPKSKIQSDIQEE